MFQFEFSSGNKSVRQFTFERFSAVFSEVVDAFRRTFIRTQLKRLSNQLLSELTPTGVCWNTSLRMLRR